MRFLDWHGPVARTVERQSGSRSSLTARLTPTDRKTHTPVPLFPPHRTPEAAVRMGESEGKIGPWSRLSYHLHPPFDHRRSRGSGVEDVNEWKNTVKFYKIWIH